MRMSKRVVICVPDSYVNMVERFMSAQAHKGLSFSVLVAMAMKSYGATDIIGPALMGSGLSSISASHLASLSSGGLDASTPKRRRGRPKKSETNFEQPRTDDEDQTKFGEQKIEPEAKQSETADRAASGRKEQVDNSSYEPFGNDPYAKDQRNVPGPAGRDNASGNNPSFEPSSEKSKEHSGWSDDAFDGIDPDFNPDGGIDNVFELLQNG